MFLGSANLAMKECILCRERKIALEGSGYEPLTICVTTECATAIIAYANKSGDDYVKTQLMNCSPDIVIAKEFQYHRSCYKDITRAKKKLSVEYESRKECFNSLQNFVAKEIIEQGKILRMSTIVDRYKHIQQ